MASQQTEIPQGLESLKTKINQLNKLSEQIQDKIIKISDINSSTNPNSNRKTNKGSTRIVEILKKYKNYVDYLKEILDFKLKKDESIIELQTNVFSKIQPIIEILKDYPNLAVIEESEELKKKKNELNKLKTKRNTLSASNKRYLVDINPEIFEKYKLTDDPNSNLTDLLTLINKNKLINCNIQTFQNDLNNAVTSYQDELKQIKNSSTGGANVPTIEKTDGKLFQALNGDVFTTGTVNELNKIKEILDHSEKLSKIRKNYENGLQNFINDFNKICTALKNLIATTINICSYYTQLIKNTKEQNIIDQQEAIDNLNIEIRKITNEINSIKEGKANITLLGLNINELEKIDDVFNKNKEALDDIMQKIENKEKEVISMNGNPTSTGNSGNSGKNSSKQGQNTVQKGNNTPSTISETNSLNTVINELNNVNNSDDIPENVNENMQILQDLAVKLNNLYNTTNTNPEKLQTDFDSIPLISNRSIPTGNINISVSGNIDRYNRIVDRINNEKTRIDQVALYIYVMKKYQNADDIKKKLDFEVRKKGLFTGIDKITLENIQQTGGKYKIKISKKSKSKSKTSKKAKSNKKTTRTQTKSYNNPEYKNQDGGFVRGGVLFPESFYRSDIVM